MNATNKPNKERGQQLTCHATSLSWKGSRCRLWINAEIAAWLKQEKVNHVLLIADTTIGGAITLKPLRDAELDKFYREGSRQAKPSPESVVPCRTVVIHTE